MKLTKAQIITLLAESPSFRELAAEILAPLEKSPEEKILEEIKMVQIPFGHSAIKAFRELGLGLTAKERQSFTVMVDYSGNLIQPPVGENFGLAYSKAWVEFHFGYYQS